MADYKSNKEINVCLREFLNTGMYHSTGAIVFKLEKSSFSEEHWGSLHLSDCGKIVELTLDSETPEDIDNSIYKLEVIAKICQQGVDHLKDLKTNLVELKKEKDDH